MTAAEAKQATSPPRSAPRALAPDSRLRTPDSSGSAPRAAARALAWASLIGAATLGLTAWALQPQCIDDAFITFRVAENLARGDGPYFNPGERVQGSTTPAYTLLLAVARRCVDRPVHEIEPFFGGAAAVAVAVLLLLLARGAPGLRAVAPLAPTLYFLQPTILVSVKGMEAFLYTATILAAALAEQRGRRVWVGVAIGLAAAMRTEGAVLGVAWAVYFALGAWRHGRRAYSGRDFLLALGAAIVTGLPFLLFVLAAHGSVVPSSVMGKIAQAQRGWSSFRHELLVYLTGFYPYPRVWGALLLGALAALGAGLARFRLTLDTYRSYVFLLVFGALYAAGFCLADAPLYNWYMFPFQVTMIPFTTLGAVVWWLGLVRGAPPETLYQRPEELRASMERLAPRSKAGRRVLRGLAAAPLAFLLVCQIDLTTLLVAVSVHGEVKSAVDFSYRRIGLEMKRQAGGRDWTYAAPEIGMLGYHSNLACLDLAGLVSPECRPFFALEPLSRTVLRFEPELYVSPYYPELDPKAWEYHPELARAFAREYVPAARCLRTGASDVVVWRRRDADWSWKAPAGSGGVLPAEPGRFAP